MVLMLAGGFGRVAGGMLCDRIGAIQDADHIYVMDEGRIVDHGSHAELIQRPGLYTTMFEQQRLSAELERF